MSVLLETSAGDIVIDLLVEDCPKSCTNFLKLCKVKYYNFSPFYNVQKDYTCQTGDPLYPKGNGGTSIWGLLERQETNNGKWFKPEIDAKNHGHKFKGTVSLATVGEEDGESIRYAASQFIITLQDNLQETLDDKLAVFGRVVEGFDTLDKINQSYCDKDGRPLKDIRIKHTYILEDPFDDPPGLLEPANSPDPTDEQLSSVRIGEDEIIDEQELDSEAAEKRRLEQEARSQALTLEMVGDLPFAEVNPQENVLFVCKLNPVTQDEDLELIFSRFGKINSCEVIKDKATGDSLQYAFIEFEDKQACERAYFKMEGVLIDDSRIHVDFSQSVAKMQKRQRHDSEPKRSKHHYKDRESESSRRHRDHRRHRDGNDDDERRRDRRGHSDKRSSHHDERRRRRRSRSPRR